MRYLKRIALLLSALIVLSGAMAIDASAQRRGFVRRPLIVRSHFGYDPFWNGWGYDPYFYDPYLREQRDRYYKEKAVKDASRNLRKDREKYSSDGVLTDKEREKLDKRNRDYDKAVDKLNRFNRDPY